MNNGDKKGWLTDLDGNDLDYFFGGLGNQWSCGCDITGTCASDDFGCNCDVNDGKLRSDYGRALKPDVPIGSVTLTEVGPGHYGEYYISPLMCSQREFGKIYLTFKFTFKLLLVIVPQSTDTQSLARDTP